VKKVIAALLLGLVLSTGTAWSADLKVGVVNVPRVLEESPQARVARDALQREFEPRERALLELQQKLQKASTRLSRDGAIMSEKERVKLESELRSMDRDMKRDQDAFREDLGLKRRELLENLQRQLVDSIRSYGDKEGFDLLLAEGVVYVKDSLDVTEDVLKHLSAK
jgi:outer membrane protein